ncbi:MAG: diguanylate cyclase [Pseudomonadales bacterium]|nr:diguanylate cyclase [Pseudomonadales bacterium]
MNHFTVLRIISVVVGAALTVLSFYLSYQAERQKIYRDFVQEVDTIASSLELEMVRNIETLLSFRGFYNTFKNTDYQGFKAFSSNAEEFHPAIYSIKWVPRVLDVERETFEQRLAAEGFDGYRIVEFDAEGNAVTVGMRDDYFPIMYAYPETEELPEGYDLASDLRIREAMVVSRWNNEAIASHPIPISRDGVSSYVFVITLPVFTSDPDEIAFQETELDAFIVGMFDIGMVFDNVLDRAWDWDPTNDLLLENQSGHVMTVTKVASLPGEMPDPDPAVKYSKQLEPIADLQWSLQATPSKLYFAKHSSYVPYALSLGLLIFTVLIEAYLRVLSKMDKELQDAARVDGLTGVSNRRRFFEQLRKEWPRAMRFGRPISAFLIDVDNFKKYNDTYGHIEGDRCLREVAQKLQEQVHRPGDQLARYGGEEFAVLLPETSLEDAVSVAERCRAAVEELNILHEKNANWGRVTISLGVASTIPDQDTEFSALLELADKVMYRSKESGRNKVSVMDPATDFVAGKKPE